jgi:hypothetical protein
MFREEAKEKKRGGLLRRKVQKWKRQKQEILHEQKKGQAHHTGLNWVKREYESKRHTDWSCSIGAEFFFLFSRVSFPFFFVRLLRRRS